MLSKHLLTGQREGHSNAFSLEPPPSPWWGKEASEKASWRRVLEHVRKMYSSGWGRQQGVPNSPGAHGHLPQPL